MPSACTNSFPETTLWACYGCHLSQPLTSVVQNYTDQYQNTYVSKKISVCTGYVRRFWGQNDLTKPTTKFDDCGLIVDGNVVIPSIAYQNAQQFFSDPTFTPTLFAGYNITFVETDESGQTTCFNGVAALLSSISFALVSLITL